MPIVYPVIEEGEECPFCHNTWGKVSGRKDICPFCERNYYKDRKVKNDAKEGIQTSTKF